MQSLSTNLPILLATGNFAATEYRLSYCPACSDNWSREWLSILGQELNWSRYLVTLSARVPQCFSCSVDLSAANSTSDLLTEPLTLPRALQHLSLAVGTTQRHSF